MSGYFVAVEGIEGSGKSTLARGVADRVSALGRHVLLTKEPGGTELGQHLRDILLNSEGPICPESEIFLFLADRAQHVRELLLPSIRAEMFVITDRYIYSTLAYQGYGRELELATLRRMNSFAIGECVPDKVLLVDLPVEVALKRASKRRNVDAQSWNRFEAENVAFHNRIREGFLSIAREDPRRFSILNGELSPTELLESALQELKLC